MRHKKYLAALICLLFGLTGAFACPGCIEAIPVPASVTGDNPRVFIDRNANAQFWFSEPNNVNVYNYRNYPTDQRIQNSGTYRIVYEYGIPFIHFDWDAPNSRSQRIIGERFLMLRKEQQMLLYDGNAEPAFWAFHGGNILLGSELLQNVRASSTLTHGGLHFAATPDRLGTHINRVWAVEGGVGERLYFERMWAHQLALSIGYVHYSRPYLFQANSRPKRLR
ncbi:MAG: hypothetical protein FWC65_03590, partial [Treponema sp.]|nr:hypothetical protein [Treponema sp.]